MNKVQRNMIYSPSITVFALTGNLLKQMSTSNSHALN